MNRFLSACLMSILLLTPSVGLSMAALGDITADVLAETVMESMAEVGEEVISDATESAIKSSLTEMAQNMIDDAVAKMADFGEEATTSVTTAASKAAVDVFMDTFSDLSIDLVNASTEDITEALTEAGSSLSEDLSTKTTEQLTADLEDAVARGDMTAEKMAEIVGEESMSESAGEALSEGAGDTAKAAEKGLSTAQKVSNWFKTNWLGKLITESGKMLGMGLLMMVPQSFMSAIVAENTRNALLATLAQPIKIGKYVLQIPDQFIDVDDPSKSIYVYAMIPSSSTTLDIQDDMKTMWPGLYGLGNDNGDTDINKISQAFSVVGDSDVDIIKRYTFEPEYLQTASFACTAPTASYSTTLGDTYMNSASSPGINLVLNNGSKFVADGTDGGNDPMQLVGTVSSGFTVLKALTYFKNKIESTSSSYDYTQYVQINATAEENAVETETSDDGTSDVMDRLFNCACLEDGDYSNLDSTCVVTENGAVLATCMLSSALAKIQAGTVIDGTGAEVTNSVVLAGHALTDPEKSGASQTGTATEYDSEDDLGYQIANGVLTATFTGLSNMIKNAGNSTSKKSDSGGDSKSDTTEASSEKSLSSDSPPAPSASTDIVVASALPGLTLAQISKKSDNKLAVRAMADTDGSLNVDTLALGSVMPVFGWDKDFSGMLSAFTAASTITNDNSGALVVELASAGGAAVTDQVVAGAPVNNYAAKGVQVYLSGNTPFTRELRDMMGLKPLNSIAEMSPAGAVADMIIFLDIDQNQVPLLVAQPKVVYGSEENGNLAYLPEYQLNPAIHYWVSLVSADLPEFYQDKYGASPMYDMQGNAWGSGYTASTIQGFFDAVGAVSPALEQQMLDHKKAMVDQYLEGPFGKDNLTTSSDLQFTGNGANYVLYKGLNPVGVPMGNQITVTDASGNESVVTDYLMPFNSNVSPTVNCILPDSDVVYYMGLVTDIMYEKKDGYLLPYNYSYSCVNINSDGKYVTNTSTNSILGVPNSTSNYTLFTVLSNMVDDQSSLASVKTEIESARTQWLAELSLLNSSTVSEVEVSGIDVSDSMSIRLFSTESSANGCPIWLLSNSPLEYGLFVATNNVNTNSSTITPVGPDAFTTSTAFVDLVSGMVVAQDGGYQYGSNGFNISVSATDILSGLKAAYPSAFSDTFNAIYANYQEKYNASADEMVYPIAFGSKNIGIYRGDLERENYVYWTYNGTSITDYFVTVNSSEVLDSGSPDLSSAIFVGPLCSETQFILSLVDGQLYSIEGKSVKFSSYSAIIDQLGTSWRDEIQKGISDKNSEFAALADALKAESERLAAATANYSSSNLTESDSDRAAIASRLSSANYLSYPHGSLKQDSVTGKYYHVVPQDGTSTDSSYYYLDFDASNSGLTTSGDPVEMSVMFDDDGAVVGADSGVPMTFNKMQTYSYRKQYGVGVTSDGSQVLGAVGGQPALFLSSVDTKIVPGGSGETMVNPTSPNFPSKNIVASMTNGGKTFYYYYSMLMQTYYALVVDSSTNDSYWISLEGGYKYNLDGTSKLVENPLAFGSTLAAATNIDSTVSKNNLLFAYENSSGYMNCWMPNQSNNNLYSAFSNNSSKFDGTQVSSDGTGFCMNVMNALSSPYNSVNIAQTPRPETVPPVPPVTYATDYYVGWDETNADHYSVDSNYTWHHLQLMDNETSAYQDLCLASKSGAVTHALFAGNLYGTSSTSSPYAMTAVLDSSAPAITIEVVTDTNTGNKKVTVVGGGSTTPYNYQYDFDALSADQLSQYQLSVWEMQVSPNANGMVVLAPNMTIGSNGSPTLSLASYSDIEADTLPVGDDGSVSLADQSYLKTEVASLKHDSAQSIYYYNSTSDGTYVRLKDGVVFNSSGVATSTYSPSDLVDLVNELKITVVDKTVDGKVAQQLIYRSPTN